MNIEKFNTEHLSNSLYFIGEEYKFDGYTLESIVEFIDSHLEIMIEHIKEDLELYVSDNKELVSKGKELIEFIESKIDSNSEIKLLEDAVSERTLIKKYKKIKNKLIPNVENVLIEVNEKFNEYKEEYNKNVIKVNELSTNNLKLMKYAISRSFIYLEYLKRMLKIFRKINKTISEDLETANRVLNRPNTDFIFSIKLNNEWMDVVIRYNEYKNNIIGYIEGEKYPFELYSKYMFKTALDEYKKKRECKKMK